MRITQKEITLKVDGRDMLFRLHLMDAFTGAWLLKLLAEKILPYVSGLEESDGKLFDAAMDTALPDLLHDLSEYELKTLITRCLNHIEAELPAGWQKIMSCSSFGFPELEHDTLTCLQLCGHEIMFNLAGFFPGSSSPSDPGTRDTSRQGA